MAQFGGTALGRGCLKIVNDVEQSDADQPEQQ
jgi:hypothetical protein